MKKVCTFLFAIFISCGFALANTNDIGANATTADCTEPTLGTYSGDANFKAKWRSNVIPLRWYNNNTQVIPATESRTCNYDSELIIPAIAPTRPGYIFAGWCVRETITFSSLSLSVGIAAYSKGTSSLSDDTSICYWYNPSVSADGWQGGNNATCKTNTNFTELENHEWKTIFSSGTLYGMAHCSKKPGNTHNGAWTIAERTDWATETMSELDTYSGSDAAVQAGYCWCKATGWKASNQNFIKASDVPLAWVFHNGYSLASTICAIRCAQFCAVSVQTSSSFRNALFMSVENGD